MPLVINRAIYATAPRLTVTSGSTLLEQLVDVAKADPSPVIERSVKKLRKHLGRVRAGEAEAVRAAVLSTPAGNFGLDLRADRCCKAFKLRLQAWPLLGDDEQARRAGRHLALLFPNGLRFTKATFGEQDAEMRRMVAEIKNPELAESLDELVGPKFIKAFKTVVKAYSEMVKAMGRKVDDAVNQRDVVVEIQAVIVQHASRVLGELDDDDPASVERVRRLLAPIDNYRARLASAGSGGASAVDAADEDEDEDEDVGDEDGDGGGEGSTGPTAPTPA